jgi:ADP-dependent NAD(P)H-hydrate dehydratase / NAD(P)H-hydrate epimerase
MIELLTPSQMAEADRRTIAAGTPGIKLMERAGRAVADRVAGGYPLGTRIAVVCGPGNNGGDGFVAARVLRERGYLVELFLLGARDALKGDAAEAASKWPGEAAAISADRLSTANVIVDALFGAGLARDLTGEARAAVGAVVAAGHPVIAVDLPSGIDGATGQVRGLAVRATETVTFARRKPGHLLMPGRIFAGKIRVADIGIKDATVTAAGSNLYANEPPLWLPQFPVLEPDGHKYRRGHALVVSGPAYATGAARLAARGALRAGAGLVTVAGGKAATQALSVALTAIMVREANGPKGLSALLKDERLNVVVLGPGQGVGKATREAVSVAAKAKRRLVLDADALTSFAGDAVGLSKTIQASPEAVLTPHEGEFKRLFRKNIQTIESKSKFERVLFYAEHAGATIILKGPDTVVGSPDGRASIAANAPPTLATAGSGDVLAGFIAGLLAQGMPAFEAASCAVWLHGECANEFGPGLIAEDLPEMLPAVLRRLAQ